MRDLSIYKEYFGLPIGRTVLKEWYFHNGQYPPYEARYELVEDNVRLSLRKGDLIKFATGYTVFRKDVRGQFGVILERYKIIKIKERATYVDYYAIVLIITGKSKGELYNVCPFNLSRLYKQNLRR